MSQASEAIKKSRTSHIENLPDGLDEDLVLQTHKGKGWGAPDQARYDAAKAKADQGNAAPAAETPASTPNSVQKQQAIPTNNTTNNISINTGARSDAKERAQNVMSGKGAQNVSQDNDQVSNVTGNNNYVNQSQDNSVRNYGGDTRVFNYQGSGNPMTDTPASAATMAGFYSPDDSHGAIAGRVSRNQTVNADAQKKYANTSHIAQGAINNASRNAYIDPASLDKRIADRAKYSRAKATTMGANLFGDMNAIQVPTFQRPEPSKPVEQPDFEKMYETYSDF